MKNIMNLSKKRKNIKMKILLNKQMKKDKTYKKSRKKILMASPGEELHLVNVTWMDIVYLKVSETKTKCKITMISLYL